MQNIHSPCSTLILHVTQPPPPFLFFPFPAPAKDLPPYSFRRSDLSNLPPLPLPFARHIPRHIPRVTHSYSLPRHLPYRG